MFRLVNILLEFLCYNICLTLTFFNCFKMFDQSRFIYAASLETPPKSLSRKVCSERLRWFYEDSFIFLFWQIIIPMLWISAAILNIPLFLTIYFNKEADFCMEYWPKPSWLPKAYTSTWVFVAGVIPVMTMTALYSRVLYSLWFKREGNNLENTQQVNVYL